MSNSQSQSSGAGGDGSTSPYADLYKNKLGSFPKNLVQLKLVLNGPARDLYSREDPILLPFTNLQECIKAQTQLQEVYFGFYDFPVKWTVDAFTSLANSCASTLRYLELQGYPNQPDGVLDLQMLSGCQSLEVLLLPSWSRTDMTFRNVEKLPISLKRLAICEGEDGIIEVQDPNVFKRLVALEWLFLFIRIHYPSAPKYRNQESQMQFYRTMIRGLLSLRKLEGFYLKTNGIGLNRDRSTVKILRPFDEHINPADRYPRTFVKFNLKWQWFDGDRSAPWSDRPFDNEAVMAKPQQMTGLGQTVEEIDVNGAGGNANGTVEVADMEEDLEEMDEEDGNSSDKD